MSWFTKPLPADLRPQPYGHEADHYILPSAVELDSPAYPEFHGIEGGPSALRSTTGEAFQDANPDYAGRYELGYLDQPGAPETFQNIKNDVVYQEYDGSVPGTNRIIHSVGPVGGGTSDHWSGSRDALHTPTVGQAGPVAGGPDYSGSLAAAYYSVADAAISQAQAEAAMVNAV